MVKTKGGRVMNPTDAFRKQQRKKEVNRNKLERKLQREAYQKKDKPNYLAEELQSIIEEQNEKGQLTKSQRIKRKVLQDAFEASIKKKKEEQGRKIDLQDIPAIPATSKHQLSGGAVIPRGLQGMEKNPQQVQTLKNLNMNQQQNNLSGIKQNNNPMSIPVPEKPPLPKGLPPPPSSAQMQGAITTVSDIQDEVQNKGTQGEEVKQGGLQIARPSRPPLPPTPPPAQVTQGGQQVNQSTNKFPLPPGPPPNMSQTQGSMMPPPPLPPPSGRPGSHILPPPSGLPPSFLNQQQQMLNFQQQQQQQQQELQRQQQQLQQQLQQQQQIKLLEEEKEALEKNVQKKETVSTITGASTVQKKDKEQQQKILSSMVPTSVRARNRDANATANAISTGIVKQQSQGNRSKVTKPQQGYGLIPQSLLKNLTSQNQAARQQSNVSFQPALLPANIQGNTGFQGAQQITKTVNQDMDSRYQEFMSSLSQIGAFEDDGSSQKQTQLQTAQ